jgi:hypothetical protein
MFAYILIDSNNQPRQSSRLSFCVLRRNILSYVVKYGEVWFDFPFQSELDVALTFIFLPTMLNAFKWYKRSQDASFDGWI